MADESMRIEGLGPKQVGVTPPELRASRAAASTTGANSFKDVLAEAVGEVQRLQDNYSFPETIYMINRVTQDFLIRPMGIFQLIDYVGIDVFQSILRVMNKHLGDATLKSDLIDTFMEKNIKG